MGRPSLTYDEKLVNFFHRHGSHDDGTPKAVTWSQIRAGCGARDDTDAEGLQRAMESAQREGRIATITTREYQKAFAHVDKQAMRAAGNRYVALKVTMPVQGHDGLFQWVDMQDPTLKRLPLRVDKDGFAVFDPAAKTEGPPLGSEVGLGEMLGIAYAALWRALLDNDNRMSRKEILRVTTGATNERVANVLLARLTKRHFPEHWMGGGLHEVAENRASGTERAGSELRRDRSMYEMKFPDPFAHLSGYARMASPFARAAKAFSRRAINTGLQTVTADMKSNGGFLPVVPLMRNELDDPEMGGYSPDPIASTDDMLAGDVRMVFSEPSADWTLALRSSGELDPYHPMAGLRRPSEHAADPKALASQTERSRLANEVFGLPFADQILGVPYPSKVLPLTRAELDHLRRNDTDPERFMRECYDGTSNQVDEPIMSLAGLSVPGDSSPEPEVEP